MAKFFDNETDYQELGKAISDIIESIAQSSQEGKKELFTTLSEQVKGMNLKDLGLAINDQGLQKEVNKELFIKFIEEALKSPTFEKTNLEIIEDALKHVNDQAISNVINNNKGPLDNLVNYFKSASANKKIGIASTGIVLGVAFSPLIVLATLIALVAIGARYVGIGIGKAGEKIKEGAIDAGKEVKSFVKDVIDKLTWEKTNFSRLEKEFIHDMVYPTDDEKSKEAQNKIRIIKMLQDEGKRSAIQELIGDGTIKNFSRMQKLVEKGNSTHEEDDMQKLLDLMKDFLPAIMASGNNKIEKVEKIVDDKVKEMKPNSHLGISSAARVSEGGITGPS